MNSCNAAQLAETLSVPKEEAGAMTPCQELDQRQDANERGGVMRAVVQDAYGSAEVLRLARIGKPEIGSNEVLVKVRAAGVDRGTWHLMAGQPYLLRRALTPTGTLVIAGGEGAKWTGMSRQIRALALSPFIRQRLTTFVSGHRRADLEALNRFIETGQVIPTIDRTYPLAELPNALRRVSRAALAGISRCWVWPWRAAAQAVQRTRRRRKPRQD